MEHLSAILFIDIETVPVVPRFEDLPEGLKPHWEKKAKQAISQSNGEMTAAMAFEERSGVYSEFAKVVCIGIGTVVRTAHGTTGLRLKALTGDDERQLLAEFSKIVVRFSQMVKDLKFCGHNIKEFDLPFLSRRMVVNKLPIPSALQYAGKKPWEVPHIDTMDLWKFGDYKHFTSLALLAELMGIPSPKSDIDGSMVSGVYWKDHDLDRIGRYCMQDVLTSARVYLKLTGDHTTEIEAVFADGGSEMH
jgi:3'-5' exonuclease